MRKKKIKKKREKTARKKNCFHQKQSTNNSCSGAILQILLLNKFFVFVSLNKFLYFCIIFLCVNRFPFLFIYFFFCIYLFALFSYLFWLFVVDFLYLFFVTVNEHTRHHFLLLSSHMYWKYREISLNKKSFFHFYSA